MNGDSKRLLSLTLLAISFVLPVNASRFAFDLSKGPVVFQYTITGAYNPIRITITGENGAVRTFIDTLAYRSNISIESLLLNIHQMASVHGLNLDVRQLAGQLLFLAETNQGAFSVTVQTSRGDITIAVDCGEVPGDPSQIEIHAGVQASAASGQVIIEDGRPAPNVQELVSQKLGLPPSQAQNLLDQYGAHRLLSAASAATSRSPIAQASTPVGGAGALGQGPSVISFSSLGRQEVFDLFLNGTRFQGQIQNSTVYLKLLHPSNGHSLNGLRVIITVIRQNSEQASLVIWDRVPFDFEKGCYVYVLGGKGLAPGDYLLYLDVEQFQTIKLPLAVTKEGEVIAWVPKYEGVLRDSTFYLRLYHPVTLEPIWNIPVQLAVLAPTGSPNMNAEVLLLSSFTPDSKAGAYICELTGHNLPPGIYAVAINLGNLHTFVLPVVVTPSGEVLPGWR